MKIAIISDIHGNMEALNAVLEDIKKRKCDKIFCLGDIAMAGPEPSRTINYIKELNINESFTIIQGNTDKMLSEYQQEIFDKLNQLIPVMANAYLADSNELSSEDKDFLKNLPENLLVNENGVKIMLCHGSPRRNDENITSDIEMTKLEEIVANTEAELIFCGHTHVPCGFATTTRKTVVNVGSVGRPFSETPKACYAIIDIQENGDYTIEHSLIKYDFETAAKKLEQRSFEGCNKLADMLRKATSRYPN